MSKKYKVGFTAGTFDLFHVGHLNILRKSKELCDYLIVGVMTDEFVEHQKGRKPTISMEDRMEMLLACSYVDEVVPVDYHNTHKQDAWSLYHFDCVFTGNDHEGEEWYRERDMLRNVGSEMIFFPYTQRISSTKIKEEIQHRDEPVIKYGYMALYMDNINDMVVDTIAAARQQCDKLVIGLLSDELYCYFNGAYPWVNYDRRRQLIMELSGVNDVIELTWDCHTKSDIHAVRPYSIVFTGNEYGYYYQQDKLFFRDNNIEEVQLFSRRLWDRGCIDSLAKSLSELFYGKKIVLWGTGKYFNWFMDRYGKEYKPAYAIDSDSSKWNTIIRDVQIMSPSTLQVERLDSVMIVICCKDNDSVLDCMRQYGEFDYRTLHYDDVISMADQCDITLRTQKDYMAEAKRVLMDALTTFDKTCDKYGLKYYITSGSLIGVVRHHSLIPWDDDIDVAMTRHDFNILKEKCHEMFDGTNLELVDYNQLGDGLFLDYMTRLMIKDSDIPNGTFSKVAKQLRPDMHNKMVLDIYVLDDASDNKKKHNRHMRRIKMLYALSMGHRDCVDFGEYAHVSSIERLCIKCAVTIGRILPVSWLFKLYERERLYAAGEAGQYYFESNGVSSHIKDLIPREYFGEGARMPMDDLMVGVPYDTDGLLKTKGYGDYMQFPWPAARKPEKMKGSRAVVR
ncbi:MAG: adenylyltransferase/cytidyltransferase family protein [Pseudobutyrivibrio sp.]|nr:adenylyltransferase/cytidyltransferase family protein [Pseudobutyrivibrio sp.]